MENLKGYKGYKKGLVCRGKQYQEKTVFEENEAKICSSGMHFCVNPFDVLDYYDLVNPDGSFNEFTEVEALDEVLTDDDKKYCTKKLKIGAKLSFGGFINACANFILDKTTFESSKVNEYDESVIFSKYKNTQIGSSGDYAQIGSIGNSAKIGSSGYSAQIGSSGDSAQIGSSGNSAKIGSSGYSAQIGSSGNSAQIGSSGNSAQIGSSGDYAKIESTGEDSVICCAGHESMVKAGKGSWITLAEWEKSVEKGRWIPKYVKTEFVDGKRIKADTFYKLINGEFVEVKES